MAGTSVHMRALFVGLFGVLLVLTLLTLLVFWDVWRSPPIMELTEDFLQPAVHDGILYTDHHLLARSQ
jgi:hypothetical protein